MKKVIIIEGPDNVGKDLLISKLKTHFSNPVELHACVPDNSDLFTFYRDGLIHSTLDKYYNESVDCIIHNRSMYGEYVYGPKYRDEPICKIAKIISNLEAGQLRTFILEHELYFILLTSSSTKLLIDNDDGKSLSNKESDIEYELKAFDEVFNLSSIRNKKRILVNNENSFRDADSIYNDVINFINH